MSYQWILAQLENLPLVFVGQDGAGSATLFLYTIGRDDRSKDGKAVRISRHTLHIVLVDAGYFDLLAGTSDVDQIAQQRHLLVARHTAWRYRSGGLLQCNALEISILCLVRVSLEGTLGTAGHA